MSKCLGRVPNCRNTIKLLQTVAHEKGLAIELEKVKQMKDIMTYGILSTPGVVIDGQVLHAGGVPTRAKVEGWLNAKTEHAEVS